MTALLAEREFSEPQLFDSPRLTLEDLVLGVWEDLGAQGGAECPVCREDGLTADGCRTCGSTLT